MKSHRQATYLLYHTFGSLSSLFSNFFQKFFGLSLAKAFCLHPLQLFVSRPADPTLPLRSLQSFNLKRLFIFPKMQRFPDSSASLSRPTALLLYHVFPKKSSVSDVSNRACPSGREPSREKNKKRPAVQAFGDAFPGALRQHARREGSGGHWPTDGTRAAFAVRVLRERLPGGLSSGGLTCRFSSDTRPVCRRRSRRRP